MTLQYKQKQELDAFISENVFFAFSKEQFETGLERLGKVKIANIGMGGFCKADKASDFLLLMKRHKKERAEYRRSLKDVDILKDMIKRELSNHEYTYTRDPEPALAVLEFTKKEMKKPIYQEALRLAIAELIAEDD